MRNRYLKRISRSPSLQAPKSPCWRLNAPVPLVTTTLLLKLSWGLIQGVVSAAQRRLRWPHCIPGWSPSGNITVLGLLLVVAGWREFGSCSVFWLLHWSPHLWSPTHSPCPLSSHTATHTCFLDPSLSNLPRVFPVPVSPLCIFQSSIRWLDKLILVHVSIRESWCAACRVVERMPTWNLKTVQISSHLISLSFCFLVWKMGLVSLPTYLVDSYPLI